MPTEAPLALILQFLAWVAARPRSYGETMDAWRTSCPRLPVWEDAVDECLVRVEAGGIGQGGSMVRVTEHGAALLAEHRASVPKVHA